MVFKCFSQRSRFTPASAQSPVKHQKSSFFLRDYEQQNCQGTWHRETSCFSELVQRGTVMHFDPDADQRKALRIFAFYDLAFRCKIAGFTVRLPNQSAYF